MSATTLQPIEGSDSYLLTTDFGQVVVDRRCFKLFEALRNLQQLNKKAEAKDASPQVPARRPGAPPAPPPKRYAP